MSGIQTICRETRGFVGVVVRHIWVFVTCLFFGCFRFDQDGHYIRDCSPRESSWVCFFCCHPSHVKFDCPLRVDGVDMDVKPLTWQLLDEKHETAGVPRARV